jgi:hypothetical protein
LSGKQKIISKPKGADMILRMYKQTIGKAVHKPIHIDRRFKELATVENGQPPEYLKPVHFRHKDIQQNEVRLVYTNPL